jgi:predicted site-specific integrase-resolvase
MEKLMKPAEYAQELGISRQAVYAKIKRGILQSKSVEGKLYIVFDSEASQKEANPTQGTSSKPRKQGDKLKDYKALLEAKDETIGVLKETVVDLKESNKQISTTLRGEIDLLKDAFHEMRTLYVHQLEHKKQEPIEESVGEDEVEEEISEEVIEIFTHEEEPKEKWIGIKKFFKLYKITKEKTQEKLTKRLKKAYKKGDKRLMKIEDKLKLNVNKNYEDILN